MSEHTYNKSILRVIDAVTNTERDFGESNLYYQVYVEAADGTLTPALFTQSQLENAIERAEDHPEDLRPAYKDVPVLLRWTTLFNW